MFWCSALPWNSFWFTLTMYCGVHSLVRTFPLPFYAFARGPLSCFIRPGARQGIPLLVIGACVIE